jgi:hypothetical protein
MSRTWWDDDGVECYFVQRLDGGIDVAKAGPDTVRIPDVKPTENERHGMSEWTDWKIHPDYERKWIPKQRKQMDEFIQKHIEECVKRHNLAVEELTEKQVVSAFRQAIECGDFIRYVQADGGQSVVYIPFEREQQLQAQVKGLEERTAEIQKTIQAEYDAHLAHYRKGCRGCIVSVRAIEQLARKLNVEIKREI